ncbi:MAG TPA: ribonuclease H-like domain-containing protein [Smithellaceae bacterium]|nr:ribonuclease H-like domain-containing protein [Smithellaceae bacterium]
MKSIDKLKRLTGEAGQPVKKEVPAEAFSAERQAQLKELRLRIESVVSRSQARSRAALSEKTARGNQGLAELLEGCEVENDEGRFFLVSRMMRGASPHGHSVIQEAQRFDMTAAAMLANNPRISEWSSQDALFLDTETTGLAGGTGTMPFLIGLGWFDEGHFHVHQILARDFGEEKAALSYLRQIASQRKYLVTFNGKAFDVNLLSTRFILNRLSCDLTALPHLDLLHPARRILGHRLENCRLATLEEQILGVKREGDIPGWEIPQRYFDWLRRRDPRLLVDIFEHNRLDVISMATLTAHLADILTARALKQSAHPDDYLAAARLLLQKTGPSAVFKILDVLGEEVCADISQDSKKKLAFLYKRAGRIDDAVQLWRDMVECDPGDYQAVSELAKYLEHRVRDYQAAGALIEKALSDATRFSCDERGALEYRLRRVSSRPATSQRR